MTLSSAHWHWCGLWPQWIFIFQEYKPYMFWMNMIDAFYQSLICFFIPYFVSLFFFFSHQLIILGLLLLLTHHFPSFRPTSSHFLSFSQGLRRLWRGSVYMGNSHHHPCVIDHSAALGHWDQNLGKKPDSWLTKWLIGKSPVERNAFYLSIFKSNQCAGFMRDDVKADRDMDI